jgi:hypothetical protein
MAQPSTAYFTPQKKFVRRFSCLAACPHLVVVPGESTYHTPSLQNLQAVEGPVGSSGEVGLVAGDRLGVFSSGKCGLQATER